MRGKVNAGSMLARAGLALVLIGGCGAPAATGPGSSAPSASQTPTDGVTDAPASPAATGLEIAWEPIALPGDWSRMVHGAGGWVADTTCALWKGTVQPAR